MAGSSTFAPSTVTPKRQGLATLGLVLTLSLLPGRVATADSSPATQLIIRTAPGAVADVAQSVRAFGGTIERELRTLDELVVNLRPASAARVEHLDGVASVVNNAPVKLAADGYDTLSDPGSFVMTSRVIGAGAYYEHGLNGDGVDVALIDSGVTPVAGLDGSAKLVNGPDLSFESQDTALRHLDTFGHGTHMAGIIAAQDPDPNNPDYFRGMAPGARLVSIKVADAHGNTDVSQVLAAIDWVVQHHGDPGFNIRVLNLSFGTDSNQAASVDPLSHAVEVAWANGVVVVVAAGNAGTAAGHLTDPAINPFVIAVGAEDPHGTASIGDDTITDFSSRGDGTRNPSLVAPGRSIISLRDPGSLIDQEFPGGRVGTRYFRGSGTSQSAAVVSGAAALVVQQHPDYSPDQVKALMTRTARLLQSGGNAVSQGKGVLNLGGAFRAAPLTNTQTLSHSTGRGTLEGSRGSIHLTSNNVELQGEQDIFGQTYDSAAHAADEDLVAAWDGGTWNGSSWSGSSWSGSSWSDATWTGSSWSGSSWSGSSWSGNVWTGSSWSGTGWSGSSWSITNLADNGWSTSQWGLNDAHQFDNQQIGNHQANEQGDNQQGNQQGGNQQGGNQQ